MNKKVFITGGAGFLGANLVRRLLAEGGFDIYVVERQGTDMWRLQEVKNSIDITYADITNIDLINQVVSKIKPDIVFHFASYGVYGAVQKDRAIMELVNERGTSRIVFAFKENHIPDLFVFASTSFVYAPKQGAIAETDAVEPINEYAVTKIQAEKKLAEISKEINMNTICARLFTPYGYYEDSQRLIPHIVLNALSDKQIDLVSPSNVRDFIFIEDVLDLLVKMIEKKGDYRGEVFNVGSGQQHMVGQVVETVQRVMAKKLNVQFGEKENLYKEPKNFIADISKAKTEFNWQPRHSLEQGIARNVEWFTSNKNLYV